MNMTPQRKNTSISPENHHRQEIHDNGGTLQWFLGRPAVFRLRQKAWKASFAGIGAALQSFKRFSDGSDAEIRTGRMVSQTRPMGLPWTADQLGWCQGPNVGIHGAYYGASGSWSRGRHS